MGLVIPATHSAPVNADAVKTSAGALLSLPVCRVRSLREAIIFLKNSGLRVIAASEKATIPYTKADWTGPIALVLGAEDTGVAPEHLKLCDEKVSIPLVGQISSLNVSVAAGILIYEAVKTKNNNNP
jgi:23S rRNA (guanosine2251-2'-O)-methyltransferase